MSQNNNNNNNNNNTYHQRQVWRQNKKRNRGPRKKRIKAELNTKDGDVETYLVKFPKKVTQYLKQEHKNAHVTKQPLLLGNLNVGPNGEAYLKLDNSISEELKGVDGIQMKKKNRGQPEHIFWVNDDRSKIMLKGYVKYQYRGQYAQQDLIKTSTVKQSEVPEKLSLQYVKGTDPALNTTANNNINIPEEIVSALGKRASGEKDTMDNIKSRRTNTARLSREDVKRKMLEFFEEKMEKEGSEAGWAKIKLFNLMNVSDTVFTSVLSEIAYYDTSKRLWILNDGSVQ